VFVFGWVLNWAAYEYWLAVLLEVEVGFFLRGMLFELGIDTEPSEAF